jgi:hypothetical protein
MMHGHTYLKLISIMSLVCEFINWFIAEEICGCFNERNDLYTVHSVFTVHIEHIVNNLHIVHTVHNTNTLHSVHIEHTLHTANTVHTVHTPIYTIDGMNHFYQYL